MISDYIHPQLLIRQNLQVVGTDAVERMNVLVVGPQYVFTDLTEDNIAKSEFNDEGGEIALRFTDPEGDTYEAGSSYTLDPTSLKLFVEGVQAELLDVETFSGDDFGAPFVAYRATPRALQLPSDSTFLVRNTESTSNLMTALRGRNIEVGDKVVYQHSEWPDTTITRTVTGFVPALNPASYGSDETSTDEEVGISSNNPTAELSDTLTVTTVTGSANYDYENTLVVDLAGVLASIRTVGAYFVEAGGKFSGEVFTITLLENVSLLGTDTAANCTSSRGFFTDNVTVNVVEDGGITFLTFSDGAFGSPVAFSIPLIDKLEAPQAGETFVIKVEAAYSETLVTSGKLTIAGTYTGETSNTIRVTVVTPSNIATHVKLRVSDEAGAFDAFDTEFTKASGGSAVTIPVPNTGLTFSVNRTTTTNANVGDVYYVRTVPASTSTTRFTGVTLNAPVDLKNTGSTVENFFVRFRKEYTGEYTNEQHTGDAWAYETVDGVTTVEYDTALTLFENGRSTGYKYIPLADGVGKIYASWRGLAVPTANEKAFLIESSDTVSEFLGRVSPLNDLAYAAQLAKQGSQNRRVYALRTNGTNAAAFTTAIKKVERNDLVYAIAVITDDIEAIKVVADHCTAMSEPEIKNFRRCYFGTDSPGEYTVVDKDAQGVPYRATVADYAGSPKLVTFTSDPFLVAKGVSAGDFFEIRGTQYEIEEVFDSTSLLLKDAVDENIPLSEEAKIIKADNVDNTLDYVISRSTAIDNRRAVNVWCEDGVGLDPEGNYFVIPNRFVAAEIAGLRVAQVPWIGLSRTEVTSIIEAPIMYSKYTTADLDRAAANGVWIVTQDLEGGDVFIRHQLTTDVNNGILYYEDSVGTNYDNISFQIKDGLDATVVGRRNVNRETLAYVNSRVFEILKNATMTDAGDNVGPQLISFQDDNGNPFAVTVSVHPTFRDRILVKGKLEMPVPSNIVDVQLDAVIGLTI